MEGRGSDVLLQSLLASLTIFVIFILVSLEHALLVASMGATAFIVFASPKSEAARPKNVLGGHLIGLLSGAPFSLIPHEFLLAFALACSAAVGLSVLLMVLAKAHHPPASGTALATAVSGISLGLVLGVLLSSLVMCLAHLLLGRKLRDL